MSCAIKNRKLIILSRSFFSKDLKVKIMGKDSKDMHPVGSKKGHRLHSGDNIRISSGTKRLTRVNTPRDIDLLLNYSS